MDNFVEMLQRLVRKIVGRDIELIFSGQPATDGEKITMNDPRKDYPSLPTDAQEALGKTSVGHEAHHIVEFEKEARKQKWTVQPKEWAQKFYETFADPLCPDQASKAYVRKLLNIVEDGLVDKKTEKYTGPKAMENSNRFLVWNRQGGRRPSIAELENQGPKGKCAAFVEALFQFEVYGQLVEAFFSDKIAEAAQKAAKAIKTFSQGGMSRTQALKEVLTALASYCPPPWELPEEYKSPQQGGSGGGGSEGGGQGSGKGEGQGQGEGDGDGSGSGQGSGKGKGKGKGQGSGSGEGEGEGDGDGDGKGSGKGKGKGKGQGEGDGEDTDEDGEGEEGKGKGEGGGGSGKGGGEGRGSGTGESSGDHGTGKGPVSSETVADANLEALLAMLEKIISQRTQKRGTGKPKWRTWGPGDVLTGPDERRRHHADKRRGIPATERLSVRQRTKKMHLLAIFLDSSGSVGAQLWSLLQKANVRIIEKVLEEHGLMLGIGQFSGGAQWVLTPTDSETDMQAYLDSPQKRLFSGSTVVAEIFKILGEDFTQFPTADLVVLTDGEVESGEELAKALANAHEETSCQIKMHGVIFKESGKTDKFRKAKELMPEHVRVWHLGQQLRYVD